MNLYKGGYFMKRTVTAFLIIFAVIFLVPISKINAEETPVSDVAPPSDAPAPDGAPVTDGLQPIEAPNLTLSATETETEPTDNPSQPTINTININVSSPGISGASGAAITIETPSGRKGIAPNLSLTYSSGIGNGMLGVGWSLELGAIQRATKRGVNYNDRNFVFVKNGSSSELDQRGDWGTNYFGAKIEGAFLKYYWDQSGTGGWVVTTKDGTKYYFGSSISTRQTNENGTFKWCLDNITDTNGNYMTISYTSYNGEIYPNEIKYTDNEKIGLGTSNSVKFFYETKTDTPPMYITNSKAISSNRLKQIEVYANGSFVRRYVLEYQYSPVTGRSLLGKVTQQGTDGTSLPPITLSYQNEDGSFMQYADWQNGPKSFSDVLYVIYETLVDLCIAGDFNGDGKYDLACNIYNNDTYSTKWDVAMSMGGGWNKQQWSNGPSCNSLFDKKCTVGDFNGDGKTDIACYDKNNAWKIYLSTGGGWNSSTWDSGLSPYGQSAKKCTSGDFNGDGKTDVACHIGDDTWKISYSTGNGWSTSPDYAGGPNPGEYSFIHQCTTGDFDGDGKTDIACNKGSGTWGIFLSKQPGWGSPDWTGFTITESVSSRCIAGDFNGDGKTDIAYYAGSGNWTIAFSKGNGWDVQPAWGNFNVSTPIGTKVRTGDFNGDGKTDLLYQWDNQITKGLMALSTGNGWTILDYSNHSQCSVKNCKPGDFNGDGRTDIACNCQISGHATASTTWHMMLSDYDMPDLLASTTNTLGGTNTIYYEPSSAYANTYLPFIVQTVAYVTVNDNQPATGYPNGTESTSQFSYGDGFYNAAEREFRGFNYVMAEDTAHNATETWFYQDDIFKGLPYRSVTTDASDNIYTWTENTYQSRMPYSGVSFPYLAQKDDYVCDGAATFQNGPGNCKHARTSFSDYDSYGNIKHIRYEGDLSVSGDERDEYTTYTNERAEYAALTNRWVVSLPWTTYVVGKDKYGTTKTFAQTWFDYDVDTGNRLKKTAWLTGGKTDPANPVTKYAYYLNGNLYRVTDPRNVVTEYSEYDLTSVTYPTKIVNYLVSNPVPNLSDPHLETTKTYDLRFGKPLTETDPNGCSTRYDYEAFGRIETVEDCGNSESAFAWEEIFYDGLGRKIRTEKEGPDGKIIVTETNYNNRGLVWQTSLPYFKNIETPKWTYVDYDPVGRVAKTTNPDGTTQQKFYLRGRTTVVDANGHQKVEEKDVYGRLVKIEEYSGTYPSATLYATTMYNYDVLGNLVNVTDAQSNVTTINYNSLSQKTNMTDPDMGTWYYTYDLNGNLKTQKDAKNQTITFEYDALNRVDWKRYPDATLIDYSYDNPHDESCPYGSNFKGRLARVTDRSGESEFCYDGIGRVVKMIQTVNGTKYNTETTYDELGRTDRIKYPDPAHEVVSYRYNGGFLEAVAIGAETHVRYTGYNAFGQPGTVGFGNGQNVVTTTYEYYPSNNRLKSIDTYGSSPLQDLAYQYDNVGNITNITDSILSTRSQTFFYDDLDRLTQAQSNVYSTITYQYNVIGNMTYNSQVGSYTYWKQYYRTKPHAVYNAGPYFYRYDANGNMTFATGKTITYNYDNMPKSINSTTFVYDYSGQRVKKNSTVYIGNLYECTGGTCTKYIFAGSNRVAMKTGSSVYYYHTDHLGSSSVITDASGNKAEELYYYPYGKTRYNSGINLKHKFTGQEEDGEVDLYYYGARYYDPAIGRFISPDSIVQEYTNPQTLNRYSYVINNPLIYKDPTGHWGDPVHYGDTYSTCIVAGFPHWMAHEIASYDLQVDYGSNNPFPWGDQSWHFNTNYSVKYADPFETRNIHFREQFDKTLAAIGKGDAVTALREFGTGLHPGQDLYAHSPEYVGYIGFYLHAPNWLPSWLGGGADDPSVNTAAYQRTIDWTTIQAQEFYNAMSFSGMITDFDPRTVTIGSNVSGSSIDSVFGSGYGSNLLYNSIEGYCSNSGYNYSYNGYNSGYESSYNYIDY
jgi:RHS repeat-associated protein